MIFIPSLIKIRQLAQTLLGRKAHGHAVMMITQAYFSLQKLFTLEKFAVRNFKNSPKISDRAAEIRTEYFKYKCDNE